MVKGSPDVYVPVLHRTEVILVFGTLLTVMIHGNSSAEMVNGNLENKAISFAC